MDVNLMKSSSENEMEIMTLLTMRPNHHSIPHQPFSLQNPYNNFNFSGIHQEQVSSSDPPPPPPPSRNNGSINNNNSMEAMREMIFRIAMMQPVHIDPEAVKPPRRKNVKISKDPQSVAARHRRERISEKIRILQRLVPGGTKMDTASMLDEAVHYVKFLKKQLQYLEHVTSSNPNTIAGGGFPTTTAMGLGFDMNMNVMMNYSSGSAKACQAVPSMGCNLQMLS